MIIHKKEPKNETELQQKNAITELATNVIRGVETIAKYTEGPLESLSVCKLTGKKKHIIISFEDVTDEQAKEIHAKLMDKLNALQATMYVSNGFDSRVGVKSE